MVEVEFTTDTTAIVSSCVILALSVVVVILILVSKSYREFIHRVLLYLALTSFVWSLLDAISFVVYEFTGNFTYETNLSSLAYQVVQISLDSYSEQLYFNILCWIGVYLFSLAVFNVHLKKTKHEITGLAVVTLLPFTNVWIYACLAMKKISPLKSQLLKFNNNAPVFLCLLVTSAAVVAMLVSFLKGVLCKAENNLKEQHKRAVKKTIPLVVLVIVHVVLMSLKVTYQELVDSKLYTTLWVIYFSLKPMGITSILLLLLCQPHVRHSLKCYRSHDSETHVPTVHQSTTYIQQQSSYTHFTVSPETSNTEQSPLIIKH